MDKQGIKYDVLTNKGVDGTLHIGRLPIGVLQKKQADRKFINVIGLDDKLVDDVQFNKNVEKECNANPSICDEHQIHFVSGSFDFDSDMLTVEQGNFISLEDVLKDNPLIVANSRFIEKIIRETALFISRLHEVGIYHLCLAPSTVFLKKGEDVPLLASHGSFYLNMPKQRDLYAGMTDYVAPEVLDEGMADERADVYAIGKLMEYLYAMGQMPYAYRAVVKKATSSDASKRYATVDRMLKSMNARSKVFAGAASLAVAVVAALFVFWGYMELMPQTENIEFVKPAGQTGSGDGDEGIYNPSADYALTDSIPELTAEEQEEMKRYQDKCEQIFRKQYEREAERVLSKIYSSSNMGSNVNSFIAGSQETLNELIRLRGELAGQAGIDEVKSQRIATEIIDKITERKKSQLLKHGVQKDND